MVCSDRHKELRNGVGQCSVPMWSGGMPAGFCEEDAYGNQTKEDFEHRRLIKDFLYVPFLGCPQHGGPKEINPVLVGVECADGKGSPICVGTSPEQKASSGS